MAERGSEQWWQDYLTHGHKLEGIARWMFPLLPASPRCKVCRAPFRGFGKIMRLFGWSPSAKNPNVCGFCSNRLPAGGAEVPVAVFVADVRDYSGLSSRIAPAELAATMSKFFDLLTAVLIRNDALIDKYMGDGLQALFIQGVAGKDFESKAIRAAVEAQRQLAGQPSATFHLPVGIAIHSGTAFVGNVGGADIVDLTAMGEVVNIANRLQAFAQAEEVLIGEELYEGHMSELGELQSKTLRLKGRDAPFKARLIRLPPK